MDNKANNQKEWENQVWEHARKKAESGEWTWEQALEWVQKAVEWKKDTDSEE